MTKQTRDFIANKVGILSNNI